MLKKLTIRIENRAKFEIADTYEWYENQKDGLGESFLKSFKRELKIIQKSPHAFLKINYHRQYPMKSFPFVILYEIDDDIIYIDAVFHTSRNPINKLI